MPKAFRLEGGGTKRRTATVISSARYWPSSDGAFAAANRVLVSCFSRILPRNPGCGRIWNTVRYPFPLPLRPSNTFPCRVKTAAHWSAGFLQDLDRKPRILLLFFLLPPLCTPSSLLLDARFFHPPRLSPFLPTLRSFRKLIRTMLPTFFILFFRQISSATCLPTFLYLQEAHMRSPVWRNEYVSVAMLATIGIEKRGRNLCCFLCSQYLFMFIRFISRMSYNKTFVKTEISRITEVAETTTSTRNRCSKLAITIPILQGRIMKKLRVTSRR